MKRILMTLIVLALTIPAIAMDFFPGTYAEALKQAVASMIIIAAIEMLNFLIVNSLFDVRKLKASGWKLLVPSLLNAEAKCE